jgi:hypothetical protein
VDDRVLDPGRRVLAELQRLVRELLARKSGGHLIEPNPPSIDLEMTVALDGEDADALAFARRLAETIDRRLDQAVQHVAAFRPGRAFCLRCGGPECDHAVPPSSRHVLQGYGATGTPRWADFAQVMLDLRRPGVDGLFDNPPSFATVVQSPEEVHAGLLRAFEHPSYRLLGQMLAGYFPVRTTEREGRGVIALTFQVAGTRVGKRGLRLGLNVLGRSPSGEELGTLWERHHDLPWRRGVRWAQAALATIPSGGKALDDSRLRERVSGILNGLARRVEREQRSRRRRTRHAEKRHDSGRRPTRMALEDVRAATAEDVLFDERRGTWVVLGARGRTHFFNRDGALVSSVRYSRDAIQRRLKAGVWRLADEEKRSALVRKAANLPTTPEDRLAETTASAREPRGAARSGDRDPARGRDRSAGRTDDPEASPVDTPGR